MTAAHSITAASTAELPPPAFDAAQWHQSALAQKLLAQCDPAEFAWTRKIGIMRDYEAWSARSDRAERIVEALAVLAQNAVTQELGYHFRDCRDWPRDKPRAGRWLDRHGEIPSAAEAVEIEFARREGREPRMRWRPSAEEADAFRAIVGAGLLEREAGL